MPDGQSSMTITVSHGPTELALSCRPTSRGRTAKQSDEEEVGKFKSPRQRVISPVHETAQTHYLSEFHWSGGLDVTGIGNVESWARSTPVATSMLDLPVYLKKRV